MKVEWCSTHDSQKQPDRKDGTCWAKDDWVQLEGECSLVPMRLIPDNALVTIITALDSDHSWYRCTGKHDLPLAAVLILAALDGEMP